MFLSFLPSVIFSAAAAGRTKVRRVRTELSTQGRMRFMM